MRTARIQELLRILPERRWTAAEQAEVEDIVQDDEGRKQYEIEGEYTHENPAVKVKAYDNRPTRRPLADLPPGTPVNVVWGSDPQPPIGDTEVRLRQLEALATELFAKLKALEERIGVGK